MFKLKNVPEELKSAINEKGYDKLTTVQSLVLNPSNNGKDLLVSSQTGSGKTLAYGLSISCDGLEEIIDPPDIQTPVPLTFTFCMST